MTDRWTYLDNRGREWPTGPEQPDVTVVTGDPTAFSPRLLDVWRGVRDVMPVLVLRCWQALGWERIGRGGPALYYDAVCRRVAEHKIRRPQFALNAAERSVTSGRLGWWGRTAADVSAHQAECDRLEARMRALFSAGASAETLRRAKGTPALEPDDPGR